jgi:hypothetical protein
MATLTTNYSVANTEGIDFTATYTPYDQTAAVSSTNSPDNPGPPFTLGTHVLGSSGTEYLFVKATTAIAQYQWVGITPTTWGAVPGTLAQAVAQSVDVGFAQTAIAASAYGWVAIRGENLKVLAKKGSLANAKLYPSTSNGTLSSTSVHTSGPVLGVILTQSCTSGITQANPSGATQMYASWPRVLV